MTVMARLHDKGVLKRKMDKNGAFVYAPIKDKKSFLAKASEKIIKNLVIIIFFQKNTFACAFKKYQICLAKSLTLLINFEE